MPVPKRDIAKAKALLKAGVPNPTVTLMTPTTSDGQSRAGRAGDGQGGRVRREAAGDEFATSLDMADKGQYEAYVLAWSGRADPDGNIFSFDACKRRSITPDTANPG
jgi:peptide/nickel transport system substrate-binding protein